MHLRAQHDLSSGHALFQQPLIRSERSRNGFGANDARPAVEPLIHLHWVRSITLQIEPRLRAMHSLRQARFSGRIELQTQLSLLEHSRSAWEQQEYFACVSVYRSPQLKTSVCCGRSVATSGAASKVRRAFAHNIRPTFAFCLIADLYFSTVQDRLGSPAGHFLDIHLPAKEVHLSV